MDKNKEKELGYQDGYNSMRRALAIYHEHEIVPELFCRAMAMVMTDTMLTAFNSHSMDYVDGVIEGARKCWDDN